MAPLVRAPSHTPRVASLIPGQSTYLGFRFSSWSGHVWEATDPCFFLSLSLFHSLSLSSLLPSLPLSLPSSLSQSINISSGEDEEKKRQNEKFGKLNSTNKITMTSKSHQIYYENMYLQNEKYNMILNIKKLW